MNADWNKQLTPEFLTMVMGVALFAGKTAVLEKQQGFNYRDGDACGFAWLTLKLSKNHRLAPVLNATGWSFNDYNREWQWWSSFPEAGQSISLKEFGCEAMKRVLRGFGVPVYSASRMD